MQMCRLEQKRMRKRMNVKSSSANRRAWMSSRPLPSFWMCVFTCVRVGVVDMKISRDVYVGESWDLYEFMSQTDESCQTWMSHVICEWVMSHVNESCHMWMSHVTCEWVMSHVNEHVTSQWVVSHIWMSHVTCEWVVMAHFPGPQGDQAKKRAEYWAT